ncbi:hypothetical protein [Candidatus Nitrosocosmicus sp. SS]|uniref:hypothetical protein n=1 Tax=Candidatus Nitrosocosmicus agrestis TaxID=2563600 RepID=UPI00122E6CA5|nr:hypothetical protein [Candidatus Nitrosocosmicus sp. SS]KAA2281596.1 hypothetical protein F1Z66_08065 [Candidatus Nitrosocosmicus sp. SS]KAF0869799.1 hypothetical protein E5N71_03345 [Candidatus Nitrosocosmicus sp. SS]MDR4490399.1 hypothetical protein [Candidatus Nitrosocosmicus sp.]
MYHFGEDPNEESPIDFFGVNNLSLDRCGLDSPEISVKSGSSSILSSIFLSVPFLQISSKI